jgi:formylglycine-generating enzyme required for sulfatase activity
MTAEITKTVLAGAATIAAVALTPSTEGATYESGTYRGILLDFALVEGVDTSNDGTGFGRVTYDYYIGKYEITQGQWTDFLNAVATDKNASQDIQNLYNNNMDDSGYSGITRDDSGSSYTYFVDQNYARRPVVWVSVLDAKRFCNWLTSGNTESGIYNMGVGNENALRDGSALALGGFAMPDENEWYKAAYYNPAIDGYHNFSTTGSGQTHDDNMDPAYANYYNMGETYYNNYSQNGGRGEYFLNEVEFFDRYKSAYGVVDMTGNVWERIDSEKSFGSGNRVIRGGSYGSHPWEIESSNTRESRKTVSLEDEHSEQGFRIVSLVPIPEPAEMGVIGGTLVGLLCLLRRKRRGAQVAG